MPQTTFVNFRGIAHKGSMGQSMAFPDVCKTPTPGGPVPIPYPNIAMAADTVSGPTTVTLDGGQMPATKDAQYMQSSGDEAGSAGGGVMSSMIKGPAKFMLYSFDVKFEGKNVSRLGDSMFHNKQNAMM